MGESYTKLSSTLVHSTVWRESAETRVVWITLLALADQHGEVQASIPGLADVSRVTLEQCEHALSVFLAPDSYSRSKTLEGRRIVEIPGGWSVVNYDLYRGLLNLDHRRALTRDRVARHRAKARNDVTQDVTPVTKGNAKVRPSSKQKQRAEASTTATAAPSGSEQKRRWLGIYLEKWDEVYGTGSSATLAGHIAKAFKPLHDAHGGPEVLRRLTLYLAQTEARFASPTNFAQRFQGWENGVVPERTRRNVAVLQTLAETPDAQ